MVKFFLGVAIVAFTTFCGYLLSKKYRKRKLFFAKLNDFNERFLTEISYYRRPILQWIQEIEGKGEFAFCVQEYLRRVTNQVPIHGMLIDDSMYSFLSAEEKGEIEKYFSILGKGDSLSQKNRFTAERERLVSWRKLAEDNAKKYGDLYIKVGFLFGLFVLIIIV